MRFSPRDPGLYVFQHFTGAAYAMLGDMDNAIEWYRRSIASNPDFPDPHWHVAALLALSDREDEAHEEIARYLSLPLTKSRSIAQIRASLPPPNPGFAAFRERRWEGLRKAGMPEE